MAEPTQKSTESHEAIHRLVDGELDAAGKEALAAKAKLDPMVRRRVEGLVEIRELVQEAVSAQTPEIDADALWAKIEEGLDAEKSAPPAEKKAEEKKPGLRAIPGGKTAPTADPAVRRRRIGATIIGAFALAAVAWLVLGNSDEPTDVAGGEVPVVDPTPPALETAHTEVVEVDFGTNIGTVFSMEGDEGERYAVVWIDEGDPASPEETHD